MGFLDSVFNAAKDGLDQLAVKQFNELCRRPTDLLERQINVADNNGSRKLIILALASKDMQRAIYLAREFDLERRSFKQFMTSNDRRMSETATTLMEALD